MRQQLRLAFHAALGTLTLTAARGAAAQGWMQLPSGDYGYATGLTSTGLFTCGPSNNLPVGASCAATGNSVTLGNGSAFLTLNFTGLSQNIVATNVRERLGLGTVTKTFSGSGPFTFPLTLNQDAAAAYLFTFRVNLATTSPIATSGGVTMGYFGRSPSTLVYNCCDYFGTYTALGLAAAPPGVRYTAMVFDRFEAPVFTLDNTPIAVGAQVGLVPEPATVVLTGAGLAAAGLATARRRRA